MKLEKFYPDMNAMFGKLLFAGNDDSVSSQRGSARSAPSTTVYHLFSEIQDGVDITVNIKQSTTKHFEYEQEIELLNPWIKAVGRNIRGSQIVEYELYADDIIAKEDK